MFGHRLDNGRGCLCDVKVGLNHHNEKETKTLSEHNTTPIHHKVALLQRQKILSIEADGALNPCYIASIVVQYTIHNIRT